MTVNTESLTHTKELVGRVSVSAQTRACEDLPRQSRKTHNMGRSEGRGGPGRRWIQSKDQNLGSEVKGSTESAGGTESTVYQPEGRKRTGLARK